MKPPVWVKRHPWLTASIALTSAGAMIVMALVALLVSISWTGKQQRAERERDAAALRMPAEWTVLEDRVVAQGFSLTPDQVVVRRYQAQGAEEAVQVNVESALAAGGFTVQHPWSDSSTHWQRDPRRRPVQDLSATRGDSVVYVSVGQVLTVQTDQGVGNVRAPDGFTLVQLAVCPYR